MRIVLFIASTLVGGLACSSAESPEATHFEGDAGDAQRRTSIDASSPGDAGPPQSDGSTAPARTGSLSVAGVQLELDPTSIQAGTLTDFNGTVWISTVRAAVLGGETQPWNPQKLPLSVEVYDELPKKSPFPIGDFACQRGHFGEAGYEGFTRVTVYAKGADGEKPLLELDDDATCATHFDDWKTAYRGRATGAVKRPGAFPSLPFTMTWSVKKG